MKTLSVIIVNYNVKDFLKQCLESLKSSLKRIDAEIFVVDNASTDGSKTYFEQLKIGNDFLSSVNFIWLRENLGFSKANNLALHKANGQFVLFLNPDTIVTETAIKNCLEHFEAFPITGAVGVRMINKDGKFLKESKRSTPNLKTSFYKLFGFSAIFPGSKTFGKYHLKDINENAVAEIEVLSGAFMMVRKKLLEEIGGFDERFFMYGEDIDLSLRVLQAGWSNYYLGNTTITHFKGESTSLGSLRHIRLFYVAMIQFVKKYYSDGYLQIVKPFLIGMILLRAFISFVGYRIKLLVKRSKQSGHEKVKM